MARQVASPPRGARGAKNGALPARRLFTVDEYHRMGEAGILGEDDRVELWEGEIVQMPPIGNDHAGSTNDFNYLLAHHLYGQAIVSVQNPVRLSERSEPQPDIAVLRLRPDRYRTGHPGPEDVLLLVEVSDTTLNLDRGRKLPRYAAAGIPEVWIADVRGRRLLVYRKLEDGEYTEQLVLGPEDTVSPSAFPEVVIRISDVLA